MGRQHTRDGLEEGGWTCHSGNDGTVWTYFGVSHFQITTVRRPGADTVFVTRTSIFPTKDAPYYRKGMWISCGACLLVFVFAAVQSVLLHLENKHRDRKYGKPDPSKHLDIDPTSSGEDKRFRYVI
jgi:hypothetical protein